MLPSWKSVIHFSCFFHVRFSFSAGYGQFPVVCALALGGSYGSMTARSQGEISVFFAGRVSKFVSKKYWGESKGCHYIWSFNRCGFDFDHLDVAGGSIRILVSQGVRTSRRIPSVLPPSYSKKWMVWERDLFCATSQEKAEIHSAIWAAKCQLVTSPLQHSSRDIDVWMSPTGWFCMSLWR